MSVTVTTTQLFLQCTDILKFDCSCQPSDSGSKQLELRPASFGLTWERGQWLEALAWERG